MDKPIVRVFAATFFDEDTGKMWELDGSGLTQIDEERYGGANAMFKQAAVALRAAGYDLDEGFELLDQVTVQYGVREEKLEDEDDG